MNPSQDYKDLLTLISQEDGSQQDLYTELLKREQNVLDVVSRMMTQDKQETSHKRLFLENSLLDFIAKFSNAWKNIFTELVIERNVNQWFEIVFKDERKIYVGCMFIFIAFFMFFITISSD